MSEARTIQVGPQKLSNGVKEFVRGGLTGEAIVGLLHGTYYEQSRLGTVFWATMSAGVILPAPGATAANPMTLANPAGSGVNASLISFDMIVTVIPGTPLTGLYGLYVNTNVVAAAVTGTDIVPQSALIGSNYKPAVKALSTSTVPVAPTLWLPFANKVTGEVVTANQSPAIPTFHIDFDGKGILIPGASVTPQQTIADTSNATVLCVFCWEEIPIYGQ